MGAAWAGAESISLRIALFTPFPPDIGGGSAQLRSHLERLPELDVQWYYLADRQVNGRNWHWMGQPFSSKEILSDLGTRAGIWPGSRDRAKRLIEQMPADLFWVVGHYEGISLAAELVAQQKRLHFTVHDDPFGTWIRSKRYRMFRPLLAKTFPSILRAARSIDVTSWGMRNLYREKYGVKCFVAYRHVAELPNLNVQPKPDYLSIGHIGTLYQAEPFRQFLSSCKNVASKLERKLRIVRIGTSGEMDLVCKELPELFESHGNLSEDDAIPILATCDFLYGMYPTGRRYELFRKTSLPIKLSTYVQAQRPTFAHAPVDSTLARVVQQFNIGTVCAPEEEIESAVKNILSEPIGKGRYEIAREQLMGIDQVKQLGAALKGEDWSRFPEFDFRR